MEFGHVLAHYGVGDEREIVDKYEVSRGVSNVDIINYEAKGLDYIVSVSTLEHVGWDEAPRDPGKAVAALERMRGMLGPKGRMFVSAPMNYNAGLDTAIREGIPAIRQMAMLQDGWVWRQTDDLSEQPSGPLGSGMSKIWIAEIGPCG